MLEIHNELLLSAESWAERPEEWRSSVLCVPSRPALLNSCTHKSPGDLAKMQGLTQKIWAGV